MDKTEMTWRERLSLAAFRVAASPMLLVRWVLAVALLVGPPIYLAYQPDHYTPLVEVLFSVFLFLLAYWIGQSQDAAQAAQRANDRWLPQAESVIFRLITLHANVRRFCLASRSDCQQSQCELPELQKDELRAVRIKMKTECEASSRRLEDIAHQLEDAIEDWRRFIGANCQGEECARIFDAIWERQQKLFEEFQQPEVSAPAQQATPE